MFFRKSKRIKELQSLVEERANALGRAELRIANRNKFINQQTVEIQELKNRIIDLENNLELVTNNLPKKIKKLYVTDDQSQNI